MKKLFDNVYVLLILIVLITPLTGMGIAFLIYDSGKTVCKRQSRVQGVEFYKYDNFTGVCLVKYKGKVIDIDKIVYNVNE